MHHTNTATGNGYNHYSSFSGEVLLRARIVPDMQEQREANGLEVWTSGDNSPNFPDDGERYIDVSMPAADILELAAEYIRSQRIDKLERATVERLLRGEV